MAALLGKETPKIMLILPSKRAVVLTLKNPDRVAALLPRHQRINGHTIAVRHGVEETKVLRNLGLDVPSPINTYYDYPRKYPTVFEHQKATSAFLTLNNRCFVFNDMGLGKSLSALWAADYLMREGLIRRVLILSTMTCMETVWQHELFTNLPQRTSIVVHGSRDVRYLALQEDVDFYVLNHDGVRVHGVVESILNRGDIDLIIVDEASYLRNSRTAMYHSFQKLLQPEHRLWMLTGLPCPNGPTDAFGIGKLVSPDRLPKYFTRWQADTMVKVSQFKWVPKAGSTDLVFNALQPAIRFRKEDCLDLPEVVYLNRQVSLSVEQTKAYNAMKEKLFIMQANSPVTAANAGVKLSKLLQICCGGVRTDVETFAPIPCSPRLEALKEAILEANAKTVVFVPYTGALNQVAAYLESEGITTAVVDGSVTGRKRTAELNAFTGHQHPQVLVANPRTTSHGLNLTVADTMVWFSPIHSLDTYIQACERMERPGQRNNMRIIHLGSNALEWGVYGVLKKRDENQQTLLDLYVQEMRGAGI